MPAKKNNQIRTYIVIGLSVVFVLVGYFRFIHNKVTHKEDRSPSAAPIERLHVPQVEAKLTQNRQPSEVAIAEPLRTDLKDIFAPLKSPVRVQSTPAVSEPPKPVPTFTLGGTIVGGKKRMAIINDQLVRLGDWIGEFRVVSIGKKGVLLDSGNKKIGLALVRK